MVLRTVKPATEATRVEYLAGCNLHEKIMIHALEQIATGQVVGGSSTDTLGVCQDIARAALTEIGWPVATRAR